MWKTIYGKSLYKCKSYKIHIFPLKNCFLPVIFIAYRFIWNLSIKYKPCIFIKVYK